MCPLEMRKRERDRRRKGDNEKREGCMQIEKERERKGMRETVCAEKRLCVCEKYQREVVISVVLQTFLFF